MHHQVLDANNTGYLESHDFCAAIRKLVRHPHKHRRHHHCIITTIITATTTIAITTTIATATIITTTTKHRRSHCRIYVQFSRFSLRSRRRKSPLARSIVHTGFLQRGAAAPRPNCAVATLAIRSAPFRPAIAAAVDPLDG
jgi:hypothetical protein